MTKFTRALVVGTGAVIALGVLTACSGGTTQQTPTASTAVTQPASATYIADMPATGPESMTMAITVEGDKVIAYATNGTDDEAYFIGAQKEGRMDLMSMYGDSLTASFDGTGMTGEIEMNETDSKPVKFAAASVAAPAGLYAAKHGDARATWVVRPDRTMTGMMDTRAPGHLTVADARRANDQAFKDSVRKMRLDRQMSPAPRMAYGTWTMEMDGSTVTATRVTGGMSI
jgi:hypothetical protein